MSDDALRLKATRSLLLATACWGLSFPVMKSLLLAQELALPGRGTFFFTSICLVYRFGLAALVMLVLSARTLRSLNRNELLHGLGVGLFGGVGIFFQMDGLAHTEASTSAFLTQAYCLILPLWVAARDRRWPPLQVLVACAMVVAGVALLAGFNLRDFRIGRGEAETILASVIFTGQILWLERPRFAECRINHSTLVMFVVTALVSLPVAIITTRSPGDWIDGYRGAPALGFMAMLVVVCTLGAFLLMNRWQRHVGAALAGLIYCMEPVFASLLALFLPAIFGAWAGVDYANETLTRNLLLGGSLILGANVLAQWKPSKRAADPAASA